MKDLWINEESFLQMARIGWQDYNNARLDNNQLLGVELPKITRTGYYLKPQMTLSDVTRFISAYNEAKKNQYD
ncbi:hypothetical protein AB7W30_22775 [Providencia manganoxydans]|uniref:hypothetical protein n=1 Tax=Providencia manganoxydans TaxID=2923283 RepID=UPI0032DB1007